MASVFLVDDEVVTTLALEQTLSGMGHEIAGTATDGLSAIERIDEVDPDVAIVDLRMPLLDGLEVANRIASRIPVILLTAHASSETVERALDLGAVTVLEKPVRDHELRAAVQTAQTMGALWKSQVKLERKLSDRKWIDRAKGKLMAEEGLDENEAYHRISSMARSTQRPMGDVARELLGEAGAGDEGGA